MPENPSIHYIAFMLFLIGFILFIAGLNIFKLEKITIHPGFKTWSIGLLLIVTSIFLFMKPDLFEHRKREPLPIKTVQKTEEVRPLLGQAPQQVTSQREANHSLDQAKVSLKNYYALLNSGNIDSAWDYLSENIQLKIFKRMSQYPVEEYKTWWQKEVHSTEIASLKYVEGYPTITEAKLDAKLIYILDGRIKCSDDHSIIHLKKDGSKWVMFDKNRISERDNARNCL